MGSKGWLFCCPRAGSNKVNKKKKGKLEEKKKKKNEKMKDEKLKIINNEL